MSTVTIDFGKFDGQVFTGRPRGEGLRAKLDLDRIDSSDAVVRVSIPATVMSVSSSFILGMFGPSVVKSGTSDAFFRKFNFDAPVIVRHVIDSCVERALESKVLFPDGG